MPYKVVSTIEKGKAVLTSVPSGWEKDGFLYWPPKGLEKLRRIENSNPDSNWKPFNCILKRSNIATFCDAEHEIEKMCNYSETETDDERYQRQITKQQVTFDDIMKECISNNNMLSTTNERENTVVILQESLLEENSNVVNNNILPITENINLTVDAEGQLDISEIFHILLTKIDAFNENLKTIDTNIMENVKTLQQNQKTLEENQQAVMLSLSKLNVQFEQIIKNYSRPKDTRETIESIQPITCLEDLIKMETSLEDPDAVAELSKRFSIICGKGKGRGINNAFLLVDAMFDRSFLQQCSWAGGSRSSHDKICFRSHTAIINFFFKLVHDSDNLFTLVECHKFFKNILKNSRQRSLSQKMRTSATKNRPKLKTKRIVNLEGQQSTENTDKVYNETSTSSQLNQEQTFNSMDVTSSLKDQNCLF